MMREPAQLVEHLERHSELPPGPEERFFGYGVMGLPFRSGHVLALRRFPASSIGPGYRSLWHRDPRGRWTFCQDRPPEQACTRYFSAAVDEVIEGPIRIDWTGPRRIQIQAAAIDMDWTLELASTPATRVLNAVASTLPERAWHSERMLAVLSWVAGVALGAGQVRLGGVAPNGQRYIANPLRVWAVDGGSATVDGTHLGQIGPAPEQAHLGDFAIPQRGLFVIGRAFFTAAAT